MRGLLLVLVIVFGAACRAGAERTESASNANFKVDVLFDYDGCRVYRFFDGASSARYFVRCADGFKSATVSWVEGKDSEHISVMGVE